MTKKQINREKLQEIADRCGDLYLMEMFWDMFDDLSEHKQRIYIAQAHRIERNQLNRMMGVKNDG